MRDSCNLKQSKSACGTPQPRLSTGADAELSQTCTHIAEKLSVDGREVGNEGEERLEDAELYVDALIHAVTHGCDNERNSGLRDGLERNEALEGTE